jgi:glutathione S-transferase
MADNQLTLFSYWRSSASWRVRIILELKGLKYLLKTVNLLKGEHQDPSYERVNLDKTVPSLMVNDTILTQSGAIIEYLDEIYPSITIVSSRLTYSIRMIQS